jgi:vancomycin resistance protein YoaR
VRGESPLYASGARRRARARPTLVTLGVAAGAIALISVLVGLAFAGSRHQLAAGTRIAGVDVGGLTRKQAVADLEGRFEQVSGDPVTFVAAGKVFHFAANQLGVEPNWHGAVRAAADQGDGFGPVRGFRRLSTRVFGAEVFPEMAVSNGALEFALDEIARAVDQVPADAALERHGLKVEVLPERPGRRLDSDAAAQSVVRALGSIERRGNDVVLTVEIAEPRVTAVTLARAANRARVALSGPVVLHGTGRSWRIPRWRIAHLLSLPSNGATRLALAGPAADQYFRTLATRVGREPVDAGWAVSDDAVRVVPARTGFALDIAATSRRLLRAATSQTNRTAVLVVSEAAPARTTAEAAAMGITERLSTYKTYNAGDYNRITNLRLGVEALDDSLVPPGEIFSLNRAIGERTAERGFRPAPVIIGTKYAVEIGGGTSQVATTAFNAAWEAGVKITERNPHALYISRYPLGRDATVYWPTLDLKFENDTSHFILVKGFPEADGIRVSIYGGEKRRVESSPGTMQITGKVPVKRVKDKTLAKGKTVVEEEGEPPSVTSVTRTIYEEDGTLLRSETWNTSYKAEVRLVRVGTKTKKPQTTKPGAAVPGEKSTPPGDGAPTTPTQP